MSCETSPPGLPLARTKAAAGPPGLPLAKAKARREANPPAPPAKTPAPIFEEWLPGISKSGWEGGALDCHLVAEVQRWQAGSWRQAVGTAAVVEAATQEAAAQETTTLGRQKER